MPRLAALALVTLVALAAPAFADPGEVVLVNGDVLRGNVVADGESVVVEHPALGRLVLERRVVTEVRPARTARPGPAVDLPFDRAEAVAALCGGPCTPCAPAPACAKPWSLRVNLAASLTSGNSDNLAVVAGAEYLRKVAPWAFKAGVGFVYAEDDGDTTAERVAAIVRVDRDLNARSYLFGQVLFDHDAEAELEYRFTPTAGYGRYLVKRDDQELKAEVGGGLVIEKYRDVDETVDPAGYVGVHYRKKWADKRTFRADLDVVPNLGDLDLTVAHLLLAYEMPMAEKIRLVLGARFDYVVDPPVDGVDELDVLLTVGLSFDL